MSIFPLLGKCYGTLLLELGYGKYPKPTSGTTFIHYCLVVPVSNFHVSGNMILRADAKTRTRRFAEVLAHSTACLLRMDIAYLLNRSNPTY